MTTGRKVVIDASVVLRLLLTGSKQAAEAIGRHEVAAPAVIVPETVNGLLTEVRFRGLDLAKARSLLGDFLALPVELVVDAKLVPEALALGSALALSAYDASYIVLAARRQVPLLTADTRLAEVYERGELID